MRKSCLQYVYETSPKKHRNWSIKLQYSALASMTKKKKNKPHFEGKEALKTLFRNKKNTTMKKSTKSTFDWEEVILGCWVMLGGLVIPNRARVFVSQQYYSKYEW